MKLKEMSAEYRASGEACFERVKELLGQVAEEELGESERVSLRRRVSILTAMGRDALSTARYLEHYYEGGTGHGVRQDP